MEFYEAAGKRRTIRDFGNISIEDEVIERIIDAGMKAPSNDHMRDWHFLVIRDKNVLIKLLDQIPKTAHWAPVRRTRLPAFQTMRYCSITGYWFLPAR